MWTARRSGQLYQRGQHDHRTPFERDRTRVIHCPAFRRLQRKTQILGTDEGDFHRTRLTHSLEVASIGRSVVRHLKHIHPAEHNNWLPCDDIISVICLLHDIGHPPFGHGGEVALNYMMSDFGGFEGNGQTLRLLSKIETSYGKFGLDLTRRALLGILKYPVPLSQVVAKQLPPKIANFHKSIRINDWLPPKGYFDCEQAVVDWILDPLSDEEKTLFQSLSIAPSEHQHGKAAFRNFDCSVMDIADDIAYGVHDLEDAIYLRLISREQFEDDPLMDALAETSLAHPDYALLDHLFSQEAFERKQAIGEMVNYFITASQIKITDETFKQPMLRHQAKLEPQARVLLDNLIDFIYKHVIDSQEARTFEYGGQTVILRLFEAIASNPTSLLDQKNRVIFKQNAEIDEAAAMRTVCDYIANMTDEYAYRMHERLFGFNTRTIFERL
ncbi:anti-phage deoxyguanosine triphosphatase [Legionella sp. W05-934-2]|jgi:dGTPase|uniref:anti-phage deoxyguanosine triphosphatase n=1 Tax=Legionella sp. W05-934-2 TaxID=1198649 RepID=UPI0034629196